MQLRHIHTRLNRRYLQLEVAFWAALIMSSIAWATRADGDTTRTVLSWLWTALAVGIWWQLTNYFGLTGRYCADCYDGVSHDSYGKPTNEGKYLAALAAQRLEKSCNSASVK